MAGRGLAPIGAVLAIVGIFVTALGGQSYWDIDGTLAAFGLALAILAALCVLLSFAGRQTDGWLAGLGALMVGYFGWFPAVTAFDDWDQTRAGTWLTFAGGIVVLLGAAAAINAAGGERSTPAGLTPRITCGGRRDRPGLPRDLHQCRRGTELLERLRPRARNRDADRRDHRGAGLGRLGGGHRYERARRRRLAGSARPGRLRPGRSGPSTSSAAWTRAPGSRSRAGSWPPAARGRRAASSCRTAAPSPA